MLSFGGAESDKACVYGNQAVKPALCGFIHVNKCSSKINK